MSISGVSASANFTPVASNPPASRPAASSSAAVSSQATSVSLSGGGGQANASEANYQNLGQIAQATQQARGAY